MTPFLGGASHWTEESAMMIAGQCTPHSLFVLDKKRTGRARSKRKNRCGGSVRAGADSPPPAGEGWLYRPPVRLKRVSLGETSSPGKARILPASLFAGATLAVAGPGVLLARDASLPSRGLRCVFFCGLRLFRRSSCQAYGRPRAKRIGRLPERRGSGSGARRAGYPSPPRGFCQGVSRGSGESKAPEWIAPGRRLLVFVGTDSHDPRI